MLWFTVTQEDMNCTYIQYCLVWSIGVKFWKWEIRGMSGNNTNCWSNKIKEILYRFHLGEYWLSQNVGNEVSFLNTLKQRLMKASDLRWLEIVQTRGRYHIYRNFKPCRYKELYLNVITFTIYRKCLSRFRMGVCCINSNQLRFANIQDNVCPLCMENEEDEIHILL